MPRFPRYNEKTYYHHVMTQGHNKNYIFDKEEDIKYYIKIIYELAYKKNIKIIAYCIMNNHTHMLVNTQNTDILSEYMHLVNTKYGMYYNKKYERVGYVFRDRYKSQGIFNERQLYICIKYIYDNPVKAGICKEAKDYPFSNWIVVNGDLCDEFSLMETDYDREQVVKNIINNILFKYNVGLDSLKDNDELLLEIIVILKKENVSLRNIAKETGIGREKVRRIYKNYIDKIGR